MEKNANYELLFIVHPDLESSIDGVLERVRSHIEKNGGKITYEENWGKRKLAYQINKCDVGIYVLWYFEAPKEKVAKIEKELRLKEEIMRFMLLKSRQVGGKKEKVSQKSKSSTAKSKKTTDKKEGAKADSEKERMKKIDEKLEKIIGSDKDNKKKDKGE